MLFTININKTTSIFSTKTAVPKCFDVTITTKQYGNENSWTLGTCVSDAAGYQADQVYSEECCLDAGTFTLTCDDSYKDGWHGGFITIQGKQYCEDFTDGHQQAQDIDIAYSGSHIIYILFYKTKRKNMQ